MDEAAVFQHAEVLHERGEGHVERAGEFADRSWPGAEPFQHGSTGGVAQGLEDAVDLG
jgi:hypothetical protein